MYPGKIKWLSNELELADDYMYGKGEVILPEKTETAKSNNMDFDDPESPDYISASPAFGVYYANKRAEKSDREFIQSIEQAKKDSKHAKFMCRILLPIVIASGFCLWLLVIIWAYFPELLLYLR